VRLSAGRRFVLRDGARRMGASLGAVLAGAQMRLNSAEIGKYALAAGIDEIEQFLTKQAK
jgi:hypothetical protein